MEPQKGVSKKKYNIIIKCMPNGKRISIHSYPLGRFNEEDFFFIHFTMNSPKKKHPKNNIRKPTQLERHCEVHIAYRQIEKNTRKKLNYIK